VTITEQRPDPFRHGDYEPQRLSTISQGVEMGDVVRCADGTWRRVNYMFGGEFGFFYGDGPVRPARWTPTGRIEVIRFPDDVEPWAITLRSLREGVWILDGAARGRVGRVLGPPVQTAEGLEVEVQGATEPFVLQSDSQGFLFAFRVLPN
jgi:hypothetical protein